MTEAIRDNPNQVELQNALLSTMTYIPRFKIRCYSISIRTRKKYHAV